MDQNQMTEAVRAIRERGLKRKSDSRLMKAINVLLVTITFGKFSQFMSRFVTTLGENVYTPSNWDSLSEEVQDTILAHEAVHIEQYRQGGFLFALKYAFYPLPFAFAYARLAYEIEAYATDIVYAHRKYGRAVFDGRVEQVVSLMSGPEYFWTCLNKDKIRKDLLSAVMRKILTSDLTHLR